MVPRANGIDQKYFENFNLSSCPSALEGVDSENWGWAKAELGACYRHCGCAVRNLHSGPNSTMDEPVPLAGEAREAPDRRNDRGRKI